MATEGYDTQWRQLQPDGLALSLPSMWFRPDAAVVALVRASVSLCVGIQYLSVEALLAYPDPVSLPDNRCRVHYKYDPRTRFTDPLERNHGLVRIAEVYPLKSVVGVVLLVQGGFIRVEPV